MIDFEERLRQLGAHQPMYQDCYLINFGAQTRLTAYEVAAQPSDAAKCDLLDEKLKILKATICNEIDKFSAEMRRK